MKSGPKTYVSVEDEKKYTNLIQKKASNNTFESKIEYLFPK